MSEPVRKPYEEAVGVVSAALVAVTARQIQNTTGLLQKLYWQQRGTSPLLVGSAISYVGLGEAWGREAPQPGQTVVTFLHESPDAGIGETHHHIRVEDVNGQAMALHLHMGESPHWLPPELAAVAVLLDKGQVSHTAFARVLATPFEAFEKYLYFLSAADKVA